MYINYDNIISFFKIVTWSARLSVVDLKIRQVKCFLKHLAFLKCTEALRITN